MSKAGIVNELSDLRRVVRWASNPVLRTYRSFLPIRSSVPRVIANSFPKAGTYLLERCLRLMPAMHAFHRGVYIYGMTGSNGLLGRRKSLARMRPGCYVQAHLGYSEQAEAACKALGMAPVLIIRDPRDVVVSHYKFALRHAYLPRHRFFADLPDNRSRLRAAIVGDPRVGLKPIGERLAEYAGWLKADRCCVVRFEELVGPNGGGSRNDQVRAVRRLLGYLEIPDTEGIGETIADELFSAESRTFRRGSIGGWKAEFDDEHKQLFKESAGELLIDYGYEMDDSW